MSVGLGARIGSALYKGPGRNLMPGGPISLFHGEQLTKLTGFAKEKGFTNMVGEYFKGGWLGETAGKVGYVSRDVGVARTRKIAGGVAGGLLAANAAGVDPFGATSAATSLAMGGAHLGIGATMMKMGGRGKLAGMAYLGATAVNTFRRGNNLGPM